MDEEPNRTNPDELLPLTEAALRLGIAYDTARKRVKAGTLRGERRGGRLYAWVPGPETRPESGPEQDFGTAPEDSGPVPDETETNPDALVAQLRDEVAFLRRQVDRQTHIIAGLIQRIPDMQELPSGIESEQAPQDVHTAPARDVPSAKAVVSSTPASDALALNWRRWWRKITGG